MIIYLVELTFFAFGLNTNPSKYGVLVLSYIIDALFAVSMYLLYIIEDNTIGLSHILLLFFFLFNFGQTFMWSLGIHYENELGKHAYYGSYSFTSYAQIYKSAIFALNCFSSLVLGLLLFSSMRPTKIKSYTGKIKEENIKIVIYRISKILAVPVIPLTFLKISLTIIQSGLHGYASLYYSNFSMGGLIGRAEDYFFPVIVGLLIGSDYKKMKMPYFLFAMYTLLYLIAGERGNWVYKLFILIWMHNIYYKKVRLKSLLKYVIFATFFLYIIGVIVDIRAYGILNLSKKQLSEAMSTNSNFITRFIFEMGSSLGIISVVFGYGRSAFSQFGNTFLTSIAASFSSAISSYLGINHVYLANYLSQDLLKISWGTGFNLFAEFYINAGIAGSFLLFFFGAVGALILKNYSNNRNNSVLHSYIACISCSILCSMVRDSVLGGFRQFVQVVLFLYVLILIVYKILARQKL